MIENMVSTRCKRPTGTGIGYIVYTDACSFPPLIACNGYSIYLTTMLYKWLQQGLNTKTVDP